jgi:hypothetical protein
MESCYPKYLYKYRKGTDQDIKNLANNEIWVPKAKNLSDPCEGIFEANIDIAKELFHCYAPLTYYIGGALRIPFVLGRGGRKLGEPEKEEILKKRKQVITDFYTEVGVYCLSSAVEKTVMWDRFSEGHTGFCIQYSSSETHLDYTSERPAIEIDYYDKYPVIDLFEFERFNSRAQLNYALGLKHRDYKVEAEFRAFYKEGDKTYPHPAPLERIIFGLNCDEQKIISELGKGFTKYSKVTNIDRSGNFKISEI